MFFRKRNWKRYIFGGIVHFGGLCGIGLRQRFKSMQGVMDCSGTALENTTGFMSFGEHLEVFRKMLSTLLPFRSQFIIPLKQEIMQIKKEYSLFVIVGRPTVTYDDYFTEAVWHFKKRGFFLFHLFLVGE